MSTRTTYSVLERSAERFGEAPALYQPTPDGGHRIYTWNGYLTAAREIAAGLRVLGIGKGEVVALASEATAEFYLADFGIMANGSIAAALYTAYPVAEMVRTLEACDARAVFVESPALLRRLAADPRFPAGILRILLTGDDAQAVPLDGVRARGREAMLQDPGLLSRIESGLQARDYAILYLTSGATGEPKMGLVTHEALVSNIELGPKVLDIGPSDAMLAFLPPAHITQRLVIELLPVYCGIPVWFAESLMRLPQEFDRVRPTIFVAPPRLWERVHASIRMEIKKRGRLVSAAFDYALGLAMEARRRREVGQRPGALKRLLLAVGDRLFFRKIRGRFGGRLRICASGSAPLGRHLAEFFLAVGLPLIEGYGLTEGGVVILNPPGHTRPGSIGKPLPGIEIRVAGDGELLVRGPTLFSGYYKDAKATAEVLREGWLHTGDLAEMDSDGHIYITGRKKEMIVLSSGRKIYPSRIEGLFRLEPIIGNVVLIGEGLPHLAALVTLNAAIASELAGNGDSGTRSASELPQAPAVLAAVREVVARVNSRLAPFEQIRRYQVLDREFSIDTGELTATLKVRRACALENFREAVNQLYRAGE